ncbi:chemotaxis protein CheB [Autumnicola psychrophila]|uniref:protein-glutamate methylesterase n=1 Tax=Autumnicola psychrophila TaxID=3075592 RepID=A0ABU3DVG2_9FLAO|nr:chemotaxis protein CheB [Zunongwangia sp. F225]MDT0687709.1 chemotaxis protein CheB [Zunongwangia sp. F225]
MVANSKENVSGIRNIIVIGASAGGLPAINEVISGLSADMDVAVMVVIHVSKKSNSQHIANSFQKNTGLNCGVAINGMSLKKGHLYVAPPEHQLLVKNDRLLLTSGPHENKYRPSIDVLFRSAAVNYGHRTIGIILTGLFEDGTSGMSAIKRCGGLCIIQDPMEAQFSDMPRSVLNKIKVDFQAKLKEIPAIINNILTQPLPSEKPVPHEIRIEANLTEQMMSDINEIKKIADHSDFVCPDCGGGLWALKNDPLNRYRCHTGHVFTEKILHDLQDKKIEESIWVSIRMLEEKENLLLLMAKRENTDGDFKLSEFHENRLNEVRKHIDRFKSLLKLLNEDLHKSPPTEE